MPTTQTRTGVRIQNGLVIAGLLLAFALRVYRLAGQSIWYDEGLSVYYARRPPLELLALVAGSDHPPLYFLLLHAWLRITAFGHPSVEYLVRYLSAICGLLLIPLVYALGRRLFGRPAALLGGLLVAISPFHVWYSQETRMYSLVTFLTLLSSYLLWTLLTPYTKGHRQFRTMALRGPRTGSHTLAPTPRLPLLAYSLIMALALYTHFYTALILVAHVSFVTWWAWRHDGWAVWHRWMSASGLAVLVFLPWGLWAAHALQTNDTYWRGTLDIQQTLLATLQAFAVGEQADGRAAMLTAAIYLFLVAMGSLMSYIRRPGAVAHNPPSGARTTWDAAMFLMTYVVIPISVLIAISYNRPKFVPRYVLTVTPAFALLASHGVVTLFQVSRKDVHSLAHAVAMAFVGIIVVGSGLFLWQYYVDDSKYKADWRSAAHYIREHASAHDAVVIVAGHAMPAFDFYNTSRLAVYGMPPRLLPTVSTPMTMGDVTTTLNGVLEEGHDRVWLILWQENLADPRRLTLSQLFEYGDRQGVGQNFHDLGVLLFEVPRGTVFGPPHPEYALDTVFGQQLRLNGYDLSLEPMVPGDTMTLRLHWEALTQVSQNYTAFTQLLSAQDEIIGQHDRLLGGDQYPTSQWAIGEPVRETYELTIAPDTPPGLYRLIAGVYLAPSGPRLQAEGNNAAGDHVVIAEIEVRRR